jgi:DNA repair exonuclease SbcCD nuclease subunit
VDHLRFLHAADLHLDSPFVGLRSTAPDSVRNRLMSATFEAYDALVALAIDERVDAVLIAGDVYDAADRSLRAQLAFVRGLDRLSAAGIRSFVCHGNHDPLDGWDARLPLPALAHRFGKDVEAVPLDPANPRRATVYGMSYPTKKVVTNLVPRFSRTNDSAFAVGLLHANVGTNIGHDPYSPCTLDDLARAGMDYWALGHVHTRATLRASNPTVVYPGNTQGRQPNETGPRGAVLVDADPAGACKVEFRPLDVVRWENILVDLTTAEGIDDVFRLIDNAVGAALDAAVGRSLVCRIQLTGRTALRDTVLHGRVLDDLCQDLNAEWSSQSPFAWCDRITQSLRLPFDRAAVLAAGGFLAEVLTAADDLRSDPANLAELRPALEPLYQGDRFRRLIGDDLPAGATLQRLLDAAEEECVDRFEGAAP